MRDSMFDGEQNLARLHMAAARLGYGLVNVPGDGNCACAVAHSLRDYSET